MPPANKDSYSTDLQRLEKTVAEGLASLKNCYESLNKRTRNLEDINNKTVSVHQLLLSGIQKQQESLDRIVDSLEHRMIALESDAKDSVKSEDKINATLREINLTLQNHNNKIINIEAETKKIPKMEERIKKMEDLAPSIRLVVAIGGVLGISAIGLIFAIMIGQVQLVF